MPYPVSMTLADLTIDLREWLSGDGSEAVVYISSYNSLVSQTDDVIVPRLNRERFETSAGLLTVQLPVNSDPDWQPNGWTYEVLAHLPRGVKMAWLVGLDAAGSLADKGTEIPYPDAHPVPTIVNPIPPAHYGIINVRNLGAKGDGVTDDSQAFQRAVLLAKESARTTPGGVWPDQFGTLLVEVPPGDYLVTEPILGPEGMTSKEVGLRFRGAGDGLTNIIYEPAAAGSLFNNDYWQAIQIDGIRFFAATSGCTWFFSDTENSAQRYQFNNLAIIGFRYGVRLEGNNNNSEFLFYNVHSNSIEANGAFFYVGSVNTVDQFLNYWFYGCSHWTTSAPYIDAARGGHFHIFGLDVSDWGVALGAPGYLFALRGLVHALGTCTFQANGVRVEAKNVNARLLYSQWPVGNISFRNVDWTSQASVFTYGDIIYIDYLNVDGASYVFADSALAGGVRIAFGTNEWEHRHRILFDNCTWRQRTSPSDVVSYDLSGAGGNDLPTPPVEFKGCRGLDNSVFAAGGASIWDATIGYKGELLQALQERIVSIRAVYGTPPTAENPLKVILPLGALVTGFQVLSPAGAVGEGDGGSWTLQTTEGVPTTIATATVGGALSAGYNVSASMPVPFLCNNLARRTLAVEATNVTQYNPEALVLIKGYW